MRHKTTINELQTQQTEASRSFWRSAAITAVSVTIFTVTAIALDMGVALTEAGVLQTVAAISAVGSIGGAAFAQKASGQIDRIESEIDMERAKEVERTTTKEVAPAVERAPAKAKAQAQAQEKTAEPNKATTKHIDAAAAAKGVPQARER